MNFDEVCLAIFSRQAKLTQLSSSEQCLRAVGRGCNIHDRARVSRCSSANTRVPITASVSETTSKEEGTLSPGETPLVRGEILLGEAQRSFTGATVHVQLEDVTHESGTEQSLKFALYGDIPDERGRYIVTARVDLQGQGRVIRGDYLSMESYPVLTHGNPNQISVQLREVN